MSKALHNIAITKITAQELDGILGQRFRDKAEAGFFPTEDYPVFSEPSDEEYQAAVKELKAGFAAEGGDGKTGYQVVCSCGWQANNPLVSEASAQGDAEAHAAAVGGAVVDNG